MEITEKIDVLSYITDIDPVAEEVLEASAWFKTEYTVLEVTEEDKGMLAWMLANGWEIYATGTSRVVGRSSTEVTAYQYYMRRRKLQSERVLNDMIREFTEAYNEGREINDQRYDELVTLYSVMLDKTEDELIEITSESGDFQALIEAVIALFPTDLATFIADVDEALDTLGDGREAKVNIRFDSLLSKAKNDLITRGAYNTTIWTTTEAGIERERALALSDLADTLAGQQISAAKLKNDARFNVRDRTIRAYERLAALVKDRLLTPIEIRNRVLSAMFNFMERRTDEYPGLDGLATIAAQLGYGEGSASSATG